MTDHPDRGAPISYLVLAEGTPVVCADGREVGKVRHVVADDQKDVFTSLVLAAHGGDRTVPADAVEAIYERCVVLSLDAAAVEALPGAEPGPAVLEATPDDVAGETTGDKARDVARRAWDRLSGNY